MRARAQTAPPAALVAAGVLSAAVVATPLVYLVLRAAGGGGTAIGSVLTRERTWLLAGNSFALAALVALSSVAIGVPTAWLISRARLPLPWLWRVLAALPLAVPSYVAAYCWLAIAPDLDGLLGAWLVLTLVSAPYVTLPVAAALRLADQGAEDAARTLGQSSGQVFWRVTLPTLRPAIGAGALLAALYALADFGAVSMMRFEAFTYGIHQAYRVGFDRTLAAVMALLLAAIAALFVSAEAAVRRRGRGRVGAVLVPSPGVTLGSARWPAMTALSVIAGLSLGVPVVALLGRLRESASVEAINAELFWAAGHTLLVGAAGAALATAMALPIALLSARFRGVLVTALDGASAIGNALPGIVVGLSLVYATLALAPGLYQTVFALALAYAVMFLPKAVAGARSGIASVPVELEQVARTLGWRPVRVWLGVTARIAAPGVGSGALLVMLTAMKELPATLLLRPSGMETLATEIWSRTSVNAFGAAAPYALLLLLVAALPAWLLSREERS